MSARNGRVPFRGMWIAALAAVALGPGGARPAEDGEPVAVTDVAATTLDTPVDIAVLANDSDPDGDVLSLTAVGAPGHGSVIVNEANGRFFETGAPRNGLLSLRWLQRF